jgi:hypothetical protein
MDSLIFQPLFMSLSNRDTREHKPASLPTREINNGYD